MLNEAYALDPAAIHALCENRVPCNSKLANHPTIQVGLVPIDGRERYHVGLIGLLNGLFSGPERVAVVWDDKDKTLESPVMTGFTIGFCPNPEAETGE